MVAGAVQVEIDILLSDYNYRRLEAMFIHLGCNLVKAQILTFALETYSVHTH